MMFLLALCADLFSHDLIHIGFVSFNACVWMVFKCAMVCVVQRSQEQ